jgi:hypothetical protein
MNGFFHSFPFSKGEVLVTALTPLWQRGEGEILSGMGRVLFDGLQFQETRPALAGSPYPKD